MVKKAKVIAFSGIDGCGKSTQINLVKNKLEKQGDVFIAKLGYFPLNDMGQNKLMDAFLKCRSGLEIIKYYTLLQHNEYKKYDYILCDRHLMCYLAYAYAYGIKQIDLIRKLLCFVKDPDLTLYFDVDVNEALKRIYERENHIDKSENYTTLYKAKEGYEKLFNKSDNVFRINANNGAQDIYEDVHKVLKKEGIIKKY